jgi:hypothetical protein
MSILREAEEILSTLDPSVAVDSEEYPYVDRLLESLKYVQARLTIVGPRLISDAVLDNLKTNGTPMLQHVQQFRQDRQLPNLHDAKQPAAVYRQLAGKHQLKNSGV